MRPDLQDRKATAETKVNKARRATKATRGIQARAAIPERLVNAVQQASLATQVRRETLDLKDPSATSVNLDHAVNVGCPARRASVGRKVTKATLARRVSKAQLEHAAQKA